MSDEGQRLYDMGWGRFLRWAADPTGKTCTDEGVGRELGDKLRELAATEAGRAAMKSAFAEGWRSTLPLREKAGKPPEILKPTIEFHGPAATHNMPCAVCRERKAVYRMPEGVFAPCWECQRNWDLRRLIPWRKRLLAWVLR